ncbi:MAG: DNA-directed DNA polymerase, partial [Nanoarchaeota archaeon]
FRKVITWKKASLPDYVEIVDDEAQLLTRLKELILEYNPDMMTGYFSDGFDLPYIKTRAEKHKVRFDLGVDHSEIISNSSGFGDTESKIKGILHLDMLKFIRNIFGKDLNVETYSLDAVSKILIGHQKHSVDLDALSNVWDNEPDKLAEYCAYNLHDSFLAYKLCEKLMPDMVEFTTIIGLPTSDVIRMRFSKLVESYILKRAVEFNVIAPNKPEDTEISQRMEESVQGAFVYEPTPGLYKDIVVFDFRSLYPTIISAHNIGPEGFRCGCCADKPHVPGKEEYWFCSREKKFMPIILEQLISRIAEIKKHIKEAKLRKENTSLLDARSYALKILANSFYGYLGFYAARWYCLECAASTTAYARNYITSTIAEAQKEGFKVIYADTDSCFLLLEGKKMEDAMGFMEGINANLPGKMELELEGQYP